MNKKIDYYKNFNIFGNVMRSIVIGIPIFFLFLFSACIFIKSKLIMTPITVISFALIVFLLFLTKYKTNSFKAWLVVIFFIAFALRLTFLYVWQITPMSDCKLGYEMSCALNRTPLSGWHECLAKSKYFYETWSMHTPFIITQTICMRLFGESLFSLQAVNVFFSSLTAVFTAMCAEALTKNKRAGIFAGLLMAFNITSLFMAAFLVNQHISTSLFMLSMYFILKKPFKKSFLNYLVSGALLAVAHLIRPEMQIVLIAVGCVMVYDILITPKKTNIINNALKLLCFLASFVFIIASVNQALLALRLVDVPITQSKLSYKLMIGLNQETEGRFSDSDYVLAENELAVKETLKERISGPKETLILMIKKLCFQFSSYNYWWLQADKGGSLRQFVTVNIFEPITQSYMFFIMIMCAFKSIGIYKRHNKEFALLYIIYIGYLCAFSLMEVQQRYAYITVPVVTALASVFLTQNNKPRKGIKNNETTN